MANNESFDIGKVRMAAFTLVAVLHITIIVFVVFRMDTTIFENDPEPVAGVMKLVDVEEHSPPPPPEEIIIDTIVTNTLESIAANMIEAEVITPPVLGAPGYSGNTFGQGSGGGEQIDYLPQHRISVLPVLPEDQIVRSMVYPPIAQRSNIEGIVYLELFIDRQGNVRDVRILRENPPDRGFGEAAVRAFRGIRGTPAEANGEPVAVRFRYNLNFKLN